ncbi:Nucleoid-associated protein YgaU, contains BON and LysM domains [Cohaesibacter sp. ES.047]|uniref:LysM peptidoglycan-binding domain-containing protein n=1 Tax=Cohaesibacter sp. ES.047 TaxID=1798205 RepID=UPI000BB79FFD|nr:LysM peptidoglycan-binding domain-containing protein [Cohaesibacter sp. ES.047]SNY93853.1 Nucleoid-associated protein YgaU, contains BON and LysM domains [Cohaesibacter sp. ES.047]
MKSAAPFLALGGGVIAVVVGIFVFGDQLGIGAKDPQPKAPVATVSKTNLPTEPANSAPQKTDDTAENAAEPQSEPPVLDESTTDVASLSKTDEMSSEPAAEPVAAAPSDQGNAVGIPDGGSVSSPDATEEVSDAATGTQPSFDIVRVEQDGQTLVAGKASPGWTVELKNGDMVLSQAEADANGDWVMMLEKPLEQGVSDLSLAAKSADGGKTIVSESNVTVAMPEESKGELLVLETKPGEASRVLSNVVEPDEDPSKPIEVAKVEKTTDTDNEGTAPVAKEAPAQTEQTEQTEQTVASDADSTGTAESGSEGTAATNAPAAEAKPKAEPTEVAKVEEPKAQSEETPAPALPSMVSIEAVEIEGDTLFVAGAAEPAGSVVRLYVDNQSISDSRSGVTGRFLFDGELDLEVGDHQARVDLIDPVTGAVTKRAEVSFSKAAPEAIVSASAESNADVEKDQAQSSVSDDTAKSMSADAELADVKTRKVIIRRGDNLWQIARRVYGAGIRYSTIFDNNVDQIRDPNWIYPGQVFKLPQGEDGWDNNFDAVESPDESDKSAMLDQDAAE